ncbi:hypothetical protein [Paenibacillus antibioticophila]|uniref:hypothetical protein n=1 Tax=Paenibacillus antibioticophila TaxID=1274374 RepID=UPI000A7E6F50
MEGLLTRRANFELDPALHRDSKIFATKQNKKMVDVVEIALREYLSFKESF